MPKTLDPSAAAREALKGALDFFAAVPVHDAEDVRRRARMARVVGHALRDQFPGWRRQFKPLLERLLVLPQSPRTHEDLLMILDTAFAERATLRNEFNL